MPSQPINNYNPQSNRNIDLVVFIEPLAALDKKFRTQMQLELKRMQNEIGISFVVVTHDQAECASYQFGQKVWCGWRAQDASVLEH